MNPESVLDGINIPAISEVDTAGINLDPMHLLWTTIVILVASHFGAKYLASVTPRGYWFWFTILNIIIGFMFM